MYLLTYLLFVCLCVCLSLVIFLVAALFGEINMYTATLTDVSAPQQPFLLGKTQQCHMGNECSH